jgi:hypothetical protein
MASLAAGARVPPSGRARPAPACPICQKSYPLDEVLRVTRAGVTYVKVHSVPRFSGGETRDEIKDEDED